MARGKIFLVSLAVLLLAGSIALITILIIRGDGGTGDKSGGGSVPDELLERYEEVARQAEEAMLLMKELGASPEGESPEEYQSDLEEALLVMEELEDELDEAVEEMDEAEDQINGQYQQYEQLYQEIQRYYSYLEKACQESLEILRYLESVSSSLADMKRMAQLSEKISRIPATAQGSEAVQSLLERASQLNSGKSGSPTPPGTLADFSAGLQQLSSLAAEISRQMEQELSQGDLQALKADAARLTAQVQSLQGQLSSQINSFVGAALTQMEALASAISGAIP